MSFITGQYAKQLAEEGFRRHVVLREDPNFEVFELEPGSMDHWALFLWKQDPAGSVPGDMPIPVEADPRWDNRSGCLCLKAAALAYQP